MRQIFLFISTIAFSLFLLLSLGSLSSLTSRTLWVFIPTSPDSGQHEFSGAVVADQGWRLRRAGVANTPFVSIFLFFTPFRVLYLILPSKFTNKQHTVLDPQTNKTKEILPSFFSWSVFCFVFVCDIWFRLCVVGVRPICVRFCATVDAVEIVDGCLWIGYDWIFVYGFWFFADEFRLPFWLCVCRYL